MRRSPATLAALLSLATPGCSLGLLQTAKTVPPGGVEITGGASYVDNGRYAAAGQPTPPPKQQPGQTFPEGVVRVGVAEHVDVAVSGYLAPGGAAEAKVSFFDREKPYALAARAGAGYGASSDYSVGHARAGLVASYEVASLLTPYVGATFTNHWIARRFTPDVQLGPGERLAGHAWTGDGVVALAAGLALQGKGLALLAEYDRWLPAQHDPGSGYQMVASNVFLAVIRVCLSRC